MSHLLAAAEARGILRFRADVLADNRRMLRLLTRLANVERQTINSGVVTVDFRRPEDGWEPASPATVEPRDGA